MHATNPVQDFAEMPHSRRIAGFTLLELMVVVVLVGIVSGLAMFQIGSYRDQTQLRQSAEKVHQLLGWAKLQSEKSGDTVLVVVALPNISIYRDRNGSGKWEATDALILQDSVFRTVKFLKPGVAPSDASVAAPGLGLADGAGLCGGGICCTAGSLTKPTWTDGTVNFCSRTSPQLSPLIEDGAFYLASTNTRIVEMWGVVANRAIGVEASLWTSDVFPTAVANWRKVR